MSKLGKKLIAAAKEGRAIINDDEIVAFLLWALAQRKKLH